MRFSLIFHSVQGSVEVKLAFSLSLNYNKVIDERSHGLKLKNSQNEDVRTVTIKEGSSRSEN